MKLSNRKLLAALFVPLLWIAACEAEQSTSPALPPEVQALRTALEPYTSFRAARTSGYDAAITDCMSNGDEGSMGVHWANPSLIDSLPQALHPEALIYEPGANGDMSLVGVEFIVPFTVRPETATPPQLFGRQFTPNDVFGVWALHVWTHRTNPSGLFAPWNPRVHC